MPDAKRPVAYWMITAFLAASTAMMLSGQTLAVFNYDLAVSIGLQESPAQIGEYGVQVNRAFGAGATVIYVPLLVVTFVGLHLRKRWLLAAAGATFGISAYWPATIAWMFAFLPGVSGYAFDPPAVTWLLIGLYLGAAVWGLICVLLRGETLIQ